VGLACAAPIYAFDAALMLPSWRAGGVGAGGVQVVEFGDVQPTGEAEPSAGFLGGLESAAALFQRLKVTRNPAAGMSPPQELALILVAHAADEMLARAVLLGGLAAWWRDRGIEADLPQLPPAEVAQWGGDGLPSDQVSIENGTIVTNSARWPLIIDPQLQVPDIAATMPRHTIP
jgi:hypothetical protein